MFGFYGRCIAIRWRWENIKTAARTAKRVIQLHSLETGDLFCCVQLATGDVLGAEGAREKPRGKSLESQTHALPWISRRRSRRSPEINWIARSEKGEKRTWGTWGGSAAAERNAFQTWVPSVFEWRCVSLKASQSQSRREWLQLAPIATETAHCFSTRESCACDGGFGETLLDTKIDTRLGWFAAPAATKWHEWSDWKRVCSILAIGGRGFLLSALP